MLPILSSFPYFCDEVVLRSSNLFPDSSPTVVMESFISTSTLQAATCSFNMPQRLQSKPTLIFLTRHSSIFHPVFTFMHLSPYFIFACFYQSLLAEPLFAGFLSITDISFCFIRTVDSQPLKVFFFFVSASINLKEAKDREIDLFF